MKISDSVGSKSVLAARGIGKTVKSGDSDLVILRDIDLEITSGEAVAIVGASGSGKSTLLAILAGLDTPTKGTVEIEGADLFSLDEDQRAELRGRSVGFVFQSFQLLPGLTALENVMLPLELSGKPDPEKFSVDILRRVGLGERLHHYPKHLSGGEQQRVALARAFVARPKLLLADEPTGSLDFRTGEMIMDLIDELHRSRRLTSIHVTHNLNFAHRADRVVALERGQLVAASQLLESVALGNPSNSIEGNHHV
jgi:putative ABC transport system ATP-binding protein